MKKTIALSLFFHIFLFIAVSLLSAHLPGGSRKGTHEKVFFVKLEASANNADTEMPRDITATRNRTVVDTVVKKKESPPSEKQPTTTEQITVYPATASSHNIQRKNIPVETTVTETNVQDSNAQGLNNDEAPPNNGFTAHDEESKDGGLDIPHNQGHAVAVASPLFSSENNGVSEGKGKGVFPEKITDIIRHNIEKVKTYPLVARKRGIEGTVYISFGIGPDGEPQELKILKGSGSSILDNATLDIVKKAAPFPHVDIPVEVPVVFKLN
ncbi:MAG: energy transducer TonB [Thermodesulfovibrionia bacterium]|nr:energy transducer TonB [Thermodesulfovibrionia bacterium]